MHKNTLPSYPVGVRLTDHFTEGLAMNIRNNTIDTTDAMMLMAAMGVFASNIVVQEVAGIQVDQAEMAEEAEVSAPALGEPMDLMTALQVVLKKSLAHDGLVRGLHEAAKVIEKHAAQLCILAEDCNQTDYTKLVKALCADHNCHLVTVPSAKTLGEWAGVSISLVFIISFLIIFLDCYSLLIYDMPYFCCISRCSILVCNPFMVLFSDVYSFAMIFLMDFFVIDMECTECSCARLTPREKLEKLLAAHALLSRIMEKNQRGFI
ncbi:hypothetical protein Cni_G27375 [Canna indica]|uniref:40S ribosomal protein S12 n=1 Tax=Canna indica TaxID=4628 RepID=A0AAQ3L4T1_9LILI|nr:hypothetical protein Cni_G27375 [Canna indica]